MGLHCITEPCFQVQLPPDELHDEPVPKECALGPYSYQELMNRHSEKERLTSVPILCRITLQNAPYKDYKLLMLTSFEATTVTSMDSQEPRLL